MAVGIMILPAAAARFWAKNIGGLIAAAVVTAIVSSLFGFVALIPLQLTVRAGDYSRGRCCLCRIAGRWASQWLNCENMHRPTFET